MKKNLRLWAGAAAGAVVALAFTSCAYDPYYSSAGGSYSSGYDDGYGGGYGYGDGYGYGGRSFSTSVFIGTGDPRWGYDPYSYSYYDYNRHCYYDPYLNGYYPVGYRPPVVYGVPHPHGWSPGRGHIRPPGSVSHGTISNYRNRESSYRNSNYGWAGRVRQQAPGAGRQHESGPSQRNYGQRDSDGRPDTGSSRYGGAYGRDSAARNPGAPSARQSSIPQSQVPYTRRENDVRPDGNVRPTSRYNTPVTDTPPQTRQGPRAEQYQRQQTPPNSGRPQAQPETQRGGRNDDRKSQSDDDEKRKRGQR